ncbi:unnamed protein product [Sphenostylis stenocarpa]|uniref:Uncharacterized protein n=1 Tax=Sphenostylis stenocarpa TaxID=92480 RepID=A0AA86W4I5_9FABA|nr:unnamed protein product [Sphenostylis stenocarpa]
MPKVETSCKSEKANDELLVQCLNRFAEMQQQFASVAAEEIPPRDLGNTPKRLTLAEMQERYSKGLCFICDAKYGSGHWCPAKQFLLLKHETLPQGCLDLGSSFVEEEAPQGLRKNLLV